MARAKAVSASIVCLVAFCALVFMISVESPRSRTPKEDWASAKEKVSSDESWKAWLSSEKAAVDAWMSNRSDKVEWKAGWYHDGISQKDGSRIVWTEELPSVYFKTPTDLRVPVDAKTMGWWVSEFRARNADMILRAARLWKLTGEEGYGSWSMMQIDFYSRNYLSWPAAADGARLFSQRLTEAVNVAKYADAVRILGDYVPAELRSVWKERLFDVEAGLFLAETKLVNNMLVWQRASAARIALAFGDEALLRKAAKSLHGLLSAGVTADGFWIEQSFGYQDYVVSALLSLFYSAGPEGELSIFKDELRAAKELLVSPLSARFENGMLPNMADDEGYARAPNADLFASAYRVFPTDIGKEKFESRKAWDSLLDDPSHPEHIAMPLIQSRDFPASGFALMSADGWQASLHYDQAILTHAQAEALNFTASYKGIDITHDAGTTGYGSDIHKEYFTKGLSHNVPLVNGEGQDLKSLSGSLKAFTARTVSVEQRLYRADAKASRTISIVDGKLIDELSLESSKPGPQKLGFALHLQGKVAFLGKFALDPGFSAGKPAAFKYWKDEKALSFQDSASFDVSYGTTTIRVAIETPGQFKVWHASAPDVPPRRREALYVEVSGNKAEFKTVFAPLVQ